MTEGWLAGQKALSRYKVCNVTEAARLVGKCIARPGFVSWHREPGQPGSVLQHSARTRARALLHGSPCAATRQPLHCYTAAWLATGPRPRRGAGQAATRPRTHA